MTIIGEKKELTKPVTLEEMKERMHQSPFEFYLTGSRFFGTEQIYSDWDYFTESEATSEVAQWLSEQGFRMVTNTRYLDKLTVMVLTWMRPDGRIDVQLVTDALRKSRVQATMMKVGIKYPDKGHWDLAWELLK